MEFSSAEHLQKKYYSLNGKKFNVGKQEVSVEGVFIAPANPSLLDSYINFIWREKYESELFNNTLLKAFFPEAESFEWEVYVKLNLEADNAPDYFLYEKLSNLPQLKGEEKVYT
ncbi:hypothetical protein RCC89_03015 [Cytophagaceae bacterium ABcell3]|nr:hypothetical protein RCC89_03015 [Cytophagaceae bacterium ABcell3]